MKRQATEHKDDSLKGNKDIKASEFLWGKESDEQGYRKEGDTL